MFGPTCWCPAFKAKLWIRTRGDREDKICSNSSFYPPTSVQKTLPKCSFSCVLSVHTEKWVPRWKLASSQLQVMIRYNLYFSLMRDQDFSTFISYFHLFNYLFLGECIFFFKTTFITKKKEAELFGMPCWLAISVRAVTDCCFCSSLGSVREPCCQKRTCVRAKISSC